MKRNLLGFMLLGMFIASTSYAQEGAEHAHHTPSQAAIDACSGKAEGDTCDYTNSKGEDKSGSCANTDDQQLFCKRARKN